MRLSQQGVFGFEQLSGRCARAFAGLATVVAAALIAAALATPALAISEGEELVRFGSRGEGAGQFLVPSGIATDPTNGHVFVIDNGNSRVSEFTPWGAFVKSFGWDVAPGAVNEVQELRVRASAGQFKLSFGGEETTSMPFDSTAAEIEAALDSLGAIDEVMVSSSPGTADGAIPFVYTITFKGSQAGKDVAQLTAEDGGEPLSGGQPTSVLEVRTRADGTPGGTGLETCTTESGCKKGVGGDGPGELRGVNVGIAVDAAGDIFVREGTDSTGVAGNNRVQKFDSAGRFLLMFGGEVNKTTGEDRCTNAQLEGGNVCGAGVVGAAPGEFGASYAYGIGLGPAGKLFVSDIERIQRFNLEGEYEGAVPVAGRTVHNLAVAPLSGDFYASVGSPASIEPDIRRLDASSGAQIAELGEPGEITATGSPVATDIFGNVFVDGLTRIGQAFNEQVRQFDSNGVESGQFGVAEEPSYSGGRVSALGTNAVGSVYAGYTASIRAFGPGPATLEAPPKVAPRIVAQFPTSVDRSEAVLSAEIDPQFWTDTRYYIEYGTGRCSEGGCTQIAPAPPAILSTQISGRPLKAHPVRLEGLVPDTLYHYRFVATSSGGGPVRGIGGEVGLDGAESTFTTYPVPGPAKADCPNQAYRTGLSAQLSDCRAYEMVSPIDKNGGDIRALLALDPYETSLSQSAAGGERFTYSSYSGFGDPKATAYTNQYLATRHAGEGWSSEALNLAQPSRFIGNPGFDNQYKAFTTDLCAGWTVVAAEPPPDPAALPGTNVYRRDDCGGGGPEALIRSEPRPSGYPVLQGISADGGAALILGQEGSVFSPYVFRTYYSRDGKLRSLCVLPSGVPTAGSCSGGTGMEPTYFRNSTDLAERTSFLSHALSADGTRAYWTDSGKEASGPGKVYLRVNPGEEQSATEGGECIEIGKACTVEVSGTKTSQPARFWGASADGSKALFEPTKGAFENTLFSFDAEAGDSTEIAGEVLGVAATSDNLSRIYFVSKEVLPGTSGASAGQPNLYLDEAGTMRFIAKLGATDVEGRFTPVVSPEPIFHDARTTPDGGALVFTAFAPLTGYDNSDIASGAKDAEVYLYEAASDTLVCVSCNPGGVRPAGRLRPSNGLSNNSPTAAWLPMPMSSLYTPRAVSNDGSRLFFSSYDALLSRDTNGRADVYEWEQGGSQAGCEAIGAELYVASSGGCLSLISSGQNSEDSELLDISASGGDAFFTTSASLLPQDPGQVDVYDARERGGLPSPPQPRGSCEGESCQLAAPPPDDPTPASAAFRGAGNVSPSSTHRRCAKGSRKVRCAKRHRSNHRRVHRHHHRVHRHPKGGRQG